MRVQTREQERVVSDGTQWSVSVFRDGVPAENSSVPERVATVMVNRAYIAVTALLLLRPKQNVLTSDVIS